MTLKHKIVSLKEDIDKIQNKIIKYLSKKGWNVEESSDGFQVTSTDNTLRLWFKNGKVFSQRNYGRGFDFSRSRPLKLDLSQIVDKVNNQKAEVYLNKVANK